MKRRKWKISYVLLGLLIAAIAAFIIFRLNSKSKLQAKLEEIHAAGYPITCAQLNEWYSIPESSENAADTMIEAFSHFYEWDKQYLADLPVIGDAELPLRGQPIPEEMKAVIAEYLRDNKQSLDLFAKASAIQHSRYPVDFNQGFSALMPYLSDIRMGVKMLQLKAVFYAENGEPQPAVDSVKTMFGIARSLDKEPLLISQLVRISCQALSVSTLEKITNRTEFTDKQLMDISQILSNAQDDSGMLSGLVGERCLTGSFLQNINAQGISSYGAPGVPSPFMAVYKVVGLADIDALIYIDLMTKYTEIIQLAPHDRIKASKALEADVSKRSKIHLLLHLLRPALTRSIELDLRNLAGIQAARVGMAIQRYRLAAGRLPNTLDELVPDYLEMVPLDPFDGKEMRYKKPDTGFVVYSIGEDGQDDQGKERPPRGSGKDESCTHDVTFTVHR